jgi:4-hydroxyproline epimerase
VNPLASRVIIEGGPDLGAGSLNERAKVFAGKFDKVRTSEILEPRGSDAMVGALLCEPTDPRCVTGVIFFNNTGYLGMCGHGTIGVAVTLAYLGRIDVGTHLIETPVGVVQVDLIGPNEVRVENVASYRFKSDVVVDVDGLGSISGSIAWGGNWFFLVEKTPFELKFENIASLTTAAKQVQSALNENGIMGANGELIDHVEFFGPAKSDDANSRNFVLCPGGEYDRSPCGTGTSAKIACLVAKNELQPGETWIQESIIGSRFAASYRRDSNNQIIPSITGSAYVCAETTLIQQPDDPFVHGIK